MSLNTPNNLPDTAQQLKVLSASAEELAHRGQVEQAEQVYTHILEIAPYHTRSLDFLAMRAYERGNTDLSLELLDRSLDSNPDRPVAYQNIGLVHKLRGEYDLALEALGRAIQLQPTYPVALLHKGSILELLGRRREAVSVYLLAWTQAPEFQHVRYSEHVSRNMRELIARSADAIKGARTEILDRVFWQLNEQQDALESARVRQLYDIYIGNAEPEYAHAKQQPAFLYFPGLRPRAFYEREDFDWVPELELATHRIREELLAVLQHSDNLQPYVQLTATDLAQWKELNYSPDWSSFHLYKAGERIDSHSQRCPFTTATIEKLPLVSTPNQAPEVFFSILKPGTHIPPHYGLANYKLAVHLPLIIPGDCAIRVGDETRTWMEDQCLIFDDSFEHEAWNNSNELRAVLILEVWNPQLSLIERQLVEAILHAIQEFDREYRNPTESLQT